MTKNGAFVSCDLIGHGTQNIDVQTERVRAINEIVRETVSTYGRSKVIWASGGDGGHVAFLFPHCEELTLNLIRRLRLWSRDANAPLRITGHYGPVVKIKGADGRVQLVGEGINMCGSLINYGSGNSVVVSEAFRALIEHAQVQGVSFHDDRVAYIKHFAAQRLFLMSIERQFESHWELQSVPEKRLLDEALGKNLRWRVIYHAKRLLQINASDQYAIQALSSMQPTQLTFRKSHLEEPQVNPFFAAMDKDTFIEFIKKTQLVEREDGEIICHYDDDGDTMCVILTGEVGVIVRPDTTRSEKPVGAGCLDLKMGPGEILGELALYLRRKRTATLQAVGRTALLSFNFNDLINLVDREGQGKRAKEIQRDFFEPRVLEHICHTAQYLKGPLARMSAPWEFISGAETLSFSWRDGKIISSQNASFQKDGLYILASGSLEERLGNKETKKVLDSIELPLVFVNLPGHIVALHGQYTVTTEVVKIVYVPMSALEKFGMDSFRKLVGEVKRALGNQFLFDAFISYNHDDVDVAMRWKQDFEDNGLKVYMNVADPMHHFRPELSMAIFESLVLVPFISSNTKKASLNESWVEKEIRYRKSVFDEASSNILPIKLAGGAVEVIGEGFSAINAVGRESAAIQEAISTIRLVRSGEHPLPFATKRSIAQTI